MHIRIAFIIVTVTMSMLIACTKAPERPAASTSTSGQSTPEGAPVSDALAAALHAPDRLAGDADQDVWRQPAAVLNLLDVKPGMNVIDYLAGGGYYTELLARLVGPEGRVVAYNNDAYLKYAQDKPAQRYGNARLPNVEQVTSTPEELPLAAASFDAALLVQSYHDLHWVSKEGHWPPTDAAAALRKLADALRPGAVVVVVDHVAPAGSDPAISVDTVHRIDPELIKRDFEAAGFRFDRDSAVLRNTADRYEVGVFDPAVRHKTDQVIFRFIKK